MPLTSEHKWFEPIYVGVIGAARVGKDSTGNIFSEYLDYRRVALADPLKTMAYSMNPWVPIGNGRMMRLREIVRSNQPGDWEDAKDEYPGVRDFLIDLGNAGRATFAEGPDFWVNRALERAEPYTVFTDIRFLNEAACLRATGSTFLIRIERPGYEPSDFEKEVRRIEVDAEVVNDGDLADLRFKVLDAWMDWLTRRTSGSLFPVEAVSADV